MTILSVRLNDEIEEKLNYIIKQRHIEDKSSFIRQLLSVSLKEEMLNDLSKKVGDGEISAWKAAEIAKVSLREMLHILKEKNVRGYTEEMLYEDLQFVKNF